MAMTRAGARVASQRWASIGSSVASMRHTGSPGCSDFVSTPVAAIGVRPMPRTAASITAAKCGSQGRIGIARRALMKLRARTAAPTGPSVSATPRRIHGNSGKPVRIAMTAPSGVRASASRAAARPSGPPTRRRASSCSAAMAPRRGKSRFVSRSIVSAAVRIAVSAASLDVIPPPWSYRSDLSLGVCEAPSSAMPFKSKHSSYSYGCRSYHPGASRGAR